MQRVQSEPLSAWDRNHTGDCAVVLTGGPGRVGEGFDLLATKRVKKLIVVGVYPQARLREIFPQLPFFPELNERDIILERSSRTTFGNAVQALPLLESLRCQSLVLITSRLHMYRARRTFAQVVGDDFLLQTRAVGDGARVGRSAILIETLKSAFYSIWAY